MKIKLNNTCLRDLILNENVSYAIRSELLNQVFDRQIREDIFVRPKVSNSNIASLLGEMTNRDSYSPENMSGKMDQWKAAIPDLSSENSRIIVQLIRDWQLNYFTETYR